MRTDPATPSQTLIKHICYWEAFQVPLCCYKFNFCALFMMVLCWCQKIIPCYYSCASSNYVSQNIFSKVHVLPLMLMLGVTVVGRVSPSVQWEAAGQKKQFCLAKNKYQWELPLVRDHTYYYQVQLNWHFHANITDIIVWSIACTMSPPPPPPPPHYILREIQPNASFLTENAEKTDKLSILPDWANCQMVQLSDQLMFHQATHLVGVFANSKKVVYVRIL